MILKFEVPGIPASGGSKTVFRIGNRNVVAPASKKTKPWMKVVSLYAKRLIMGVGNPPPFEGEVSFIFDFVMPRPKSHYRTKNGKPTTEIRSDCLSLPIVTNPDLTKMVRSTEDALTGIIWRDDSNVIEQVNAKKYCSADGWTGVRIHVKLHKE